MTTPAPAAAATDAATDPAADAAVDTGYLHLLVAGADAAADAHLRRGPGQVAALPHREAMRAVKDLLAVRTCPASRHAGSARALAATAPLLEHLESLQHPDGLFDGDNLASPPDSSFTVTDACLALRLVARSGDPELEGVAQRLRGTARRAAPALLAGGVHTPNHRWELAAALAHLHELLGEPALLERARQWLAEGVDADADGQYSERSANYAAHVTNPALLTLARAAGRPDLLDVVRANLRTTAALTDAAGEVETVHSRRQDQRERFDAGAFLSQWRLFAVLDADPLLVAAVRAALRRPVPAPEHHLAELLLDERLARPLPDVPAPPAESRTALPVSGLVRTVTGGSTVTVFGGGDHHRFPVVASGLAHSSTFLRLRHGRAVLDAVRLSPHFFGTGPFRADGLREDGDALVLRESRTARYYQPLPPQRRSPTGEYRLEHEGRFHAAMSFSERPADELHLGTEVRVRTTRTGDGTLTEVDAAFTGTPTSWVLALTFREGGRFSGVQQGPGGTLLLAEGTGAYRVGDDEVEFGPGHGTGADRPARFDPGEQVAYPGGADDVPGRTVLITGRTTAPLRLRLRARTLPGAEQGQEQGQGRS